ncbi:BSD [Macleaya cordata]|uniref:BSD n=1 Tax=Macleaya cordata TaxID=56857 RepID=A0A200Q1V1_MACCD|nr:BSD [Macleaya cordata]
MDFFKSVFSEDPDPSEGSVSESPKQNVEEKQDQETQLHEPDPSINSSPKSSTTGSAWSFGGLIKTLTTKSESVIQTYKRDLEEFSTGLKNETVAIREAASRAVKELPVSIEVGASVAQESLESVGQVIDGFGSSVWRGTTEIISHGKDALLSGDLESDSSDNQQHFRNSKRYSRFEANVYAIQNDLSTYSEEPDDLDEFRKWKLGFDLEEKGEEIENLLDENGVMEGIYTKLVPSVIEIETFWTRYFYKVYKLKQAEDARANLVKRVISGEEEDLSWDVDDDEANVSESMVGSSGVEELEKKEIKESVNENKPVEELQVESSGVVDRKIEDKDLVVETNSENGSDKEMMLKEKLDESESNNNKPVTKPDEKVIVEGKTESGESAKSSDFSVISSQPSLPEEEDLGWDEIEDVGSSDEKKVTVSGSPNRADLRKRLSTADEDEDLSWDIEDDDEPVKH